MSFIYLLIYFFPSGVPCDLTRHAVCWWKGYCILCLLINNLLISIFKILLTNYNQYFLIFFRLLYIYLCVHNNTSREWKKIVANPPTPCQSFRIAHTPIHSIAWWMNFSEEAKLSNQECGQTSNFFTDMTQVTWFILPLLSPFILLVSMVKRYGRWRGAGVCGRKVAEPEVNTRMSVFSVKVRRLVSGESSSHFGLFIRFV